MREGKVERGEERRGRERKQELCKRRENMN